MSSLKGTKNYINWHRENISFIPHNWALVPVKPGKIEYYFILNVYYYFLTLKLFGPYKSLCFRIEKWENPTSANQVSIRCRQVHFIHREQISSPHLEVTDVWFDPSPRLLKFNKFWNKCLFVCLFVFVVVESWKLLRHIEQNELYLLEEYLTSKL